MATQFLLAFNEQFNMYSSWSEELYCSILKDGSLSLRARKNGLAGRSWFNSIKGIRTPEQFIDGFESIADIETDSWSLKSDILPELFLHLPKFAVTTNKFIEIDDDYGDAEMDFSFSPTNFYSTPTTHFQEVLIRQSKRSRSFSIL